MAGIYRIRLRRASIKPSYADAGFAAGQTWLQHGVSRIVHRLSIAHPDFRQELLEFVKQKHYVYEDEQVWQQVLDNYPRELEELRQFGESMLFVRPLKGGDERMLQEFFYSHNSETIYNRYFAPKLQLAHREATKLCSVDYRSRMALAAFKQEGNESILALARYAANPRSSMAETAVVVHEEFRRSGLARYLLKQLERHAINHGIAGFCSEILSTNEAMLNYHRKLGHSLVYSNDSNTYKMEFKFNRQDVSTGSVTQSV